MIHFLGSSGNKKLPGYKSLTKSQDIVEFEPDNVYFQLFDGKMKALDLKVEIGDEVKIGTLLGIRPDFNLPVYSSVSGTVTGKEKVFSPSLGRPVEHLVIKNNKKKEESLLKPLSFELATVEELVSRVQEAGVVGLGGAGFPTFIKYKNVKNIKTILINGVECEPYLTTDFIMMQKRRDDLFKGIQIMMKMASATNAIIAFKKDKVELLAKLQEVIANYPNISIKTVKNAYPMGWERTLIHEVFKKNYAKLPSEIGIIVNNAQTAIAVADAIEGKIVSHKVITISGDGISLPSNVQTPVGTLAVDLITLAGGYSAAKVALLFGGPMTSKGLMTDVAPIALNNGAITVMKRLELASLPCLRCGACSDHCPASLQPVEIKIAVENKDTDRIASMDVMQCVECGLCSYICPSHIEVSDFVKKAKLQMKIIEMKAAAQAANNPEKK